MSLHLKKQLSNNEDNQFQSTCGLCVWFVCGSCVVRVCLVVVGVCVWLVCVVSVYQVWCL